MAVDHRSLYRTYRPQTFTDVVGQGHITETLARAVDTDRVHHAYLFTGPRGTGKTSTARILAKALNCLNGPTATPCGQCQPCTDIADGSHVDVIEIDAASHGGVDDIRDLRDRVAFAPAQARVKVYIVDECHMLSTAGWNAFLKTVEEPPGHVLFVFATTEPHKVLDTILSRTQRFDFRRVSAAALAAHVDDVAAREGLRLDPVARDLVVRAGDGSVRDTLSVLDQVRAFVGDDIGSEAVAEVLGTVGSGVLGELVDGIAAGDVAGLCALVGRLADSGVDLRQLARDATEHLRRLLLVCAAPDSDLLELGEDTRAELAGQADRLGLPALLRAVELLAEAQAQMRRGNVRLPLELALIKAARPETTGDPEALAARLDRLERGSGASSGRGGRDGDAQPAADPPEGATEPELSEPELSEPQPAEPESASSEPEPEPGRVAAEPEPEPAPASSEPASASGRPAVGEPVSSGLTLEQIQARWTEVLEAAKARKRLAHMTLEAGVPSALNAKVLTLAYGPQYAGHGQQVADERVQEPAAEALEAVFGVRLRVKAHMLDHEPAGVAPAAAASAPDEAHGPSPGPPAATAATESEAVSEVEAAETHGDAADDGPTHQEAVQRLQRDLGARPLGDADAGGR